MSETVYAKDIILKSTGIIYFGDPTTEGSWKKIRVGNDIVFYRYESSVWVEKGRVTA